MRDPLDTTIDEPPFDADEATHLLFSVDRSRAQFAWKVGGLTADQLHRRAVPTSSLDDPADDLYAVWSQAVRRARAAWSEAIGDGGLGQPSKLVFDDGACPTLRRALVDLSDEYARHVGHADLLREAIDGLVGEDPPQT